MSLEFSEKWRGDTRARLEKILTENIVPFWYPATVDKEHGGYRLNHDVYGKPMKGGSKMIVTQARMVWYFSKLYNSGWGGKESLQAAEHGFRFLRDKMWDEKYGGFYWETDLEGNVPKNHKHMYGQGFALYGISEYALASKDPEPLNLANELFSLMEKHAYDKTFGGYQEFFSRDWSAPEAADGILATMLGVKLMNTHLHLLEPFTTYVKVSKNELAKKRLNELIFILSNSVVRMKVGVCTDLHDSSWKPIHGPQQDRVSYGHNIEAIWLIVEACRECGIPDAILSNFYRTIFDYCIEYGFDNKKGGLYDSGPFNMPADRLSKVWWVQAEALVAMAYMYQMMRDTRYLELFEKVLNWIEKYQVDWKNGDWFNVILPDGKPMLNKADIWKSAYHDGRAMIEVLSILDKL